MDPMLYPDYCRVYDDDGRVICESAAWCLSRYDVMVMSSECVVVNECEP